MMTTTDHDHDADGDEKEDQDEDEDDDDDDDDDHDADEDENLRHLLLTSKRRVGCKALSFLLNRMGNMSHNIIYVLCRKIKMSCQYSTMFQELSQMSTMLRKYKHGKK